MIKNTFLMFSSTALRLITGVLLLLLMARIWGAETFGVFMYPFTLAGLIAILINYGFNLQIVRDVGKNPQNAHKITCLGLTVKIILTSLVVVLAMGIIPFLEVLNGYRGILALLICANILNSFGMLFNLSLRGMGLFNEEVAITFWFNIVTLVVIGGLVFLGYGPTAIAFGFVLTKGFFAGLSWLVYRRIMKSPQFILPQLKELRHSLRTGFPFAIHVALGTLYFQVDTIIIQYFMGAEAVGIYQAGLRIMLAGLILTDVISNVYMVRMANESYDRSQLVILSTRMTRHCLVFGVIGFVCLYGFADLVVGLVYGGNYSALIPLFPLFAVVLFLRYLGASYGIILTVADRQLVRTVAVSLSCVVSVSLNFLLIPHFQLLGALYASILTHIFLTSIYVVFARRQVNSWLMDWRSYALILVAVISGLIYQCLVIEQNMLRVVLLSFVVVLSVGLGLTLGERKTVLERFSRFFVATS